MTLVITNSFISQIIKQNHTVVQAHYLRLRGFLNNEFLLTLEAVLPDVNKEDIWLYILPHLSLKPDMNPSDSS